MLYFTFFFNIICKNTDICGVLYNSSPKIHSIYSIFCFFVCKNTGTCGVLRSSSPKTHGIYGIFCSKDAGVLYSSKQAGNLQKHWYLQCSVQLESKNMVFTKFLLFSLPKHWYLQCFVQLKSQNSWYLQHFLLQRCLPKCGPGGNRTRTSPFCHLVHDPEKRSKNTPSTAAIYAKSGTLCQGLPPDPLATHFVRKQQRSS